MKRNNRKQNTSDLYERMRYSLISSIWRSDKGAMQSKIFGENSCLQQNFLPLTDLETFVRKQAKNEQEGVSVSGEDGIEMTKLQMAKRKMLAE